MSTTRAASHAPAKPVLEMTDEELRKSYLLFFPDGQPPEQERLGHYATEFQKLSFLEDVPVHYSMHTQTKE